MAKFQFNSHPVFCSPVIQSRGAILVTTLWILMILSIIAMGFSIDLQLEARLSRNQLDIHQSYYLARAGINRAIIELKNDAMLDHKARKAVYDALSDSWALTEDTKKIFTDVEIGEGTYTVRVEDETGRLNINKATMKMFEGLFRSLNFDEDDSKMYAVAIIDYRDPDDLYALDTTITEEDFYFAGQDTTKIRKFKNADYISPDELLRVPGITPEILYKKRPVKDNPEMKVALIDLLTVEGDGLVNINTAPLPVITALILSFGQDMDVDDAMTIAQRIVDRRNGSDGEPGTSDDKPYTNTADVASELGTLNPILSSTISQGVRVTSNLFRITATGEINHARSTIQALVKREWVVTTLTDQEKKEFENETRTSKEGVQIQILRWNEM